MTLALKVTGQSITARLSLPELIHSATALSGSGRVDAACDLYANWIEGNADHPLLYAAWFNLSTLFASLNNTVATVDALERSIAHNADFLPAYINLGRIYEDVGDVDRALTIWYTGVGRPMQINGLAITNLTTALKQIARVQMERDQALAEQALARCLSIDPSQDDALEQYLALRMRELKWPVLAPVERLDSSSMLRRLHPLSVAAYTDDPLLQLSAGHAFARRVLKGEARNQGDFDRRDASIDVSGRRMRVGYVSSDLRDHAIGYLLTEFFELQDNEQIETFAYFVGNEAPSAITTRIQAAVEHWRDARRLSDDELAELIANDGIDILVDVNGHTRDARLGVFARRPAPIQVNWLGYPGSMGTPFHHYIVADPWIIPEDFEKYYSEAVVRLPCYQANDRKRTVAERPSREAAGLPEDAFVFCSFNALHKITAFTLERWIDILRATPGSVLWLLDGSSQAKQTLATKFAKGGVAASRLVFAPKLQNAHHLARYPLADLFLDTLPYGAHTTASDALWMGVPVLTWSGRSFASRVCGSLVKAAGLGELVVARSEDYVARAIALAHDRDALLSLKAKLADGKETCVLFDQPQLAREMCALYKSMIAAHQAGQTPRPDLANLEHYLEAGAEFDHEKIEMASAADYEGLYRAKMAQAHAREPMPADSRLWRP